jgi:hypothetical protein
MAARTKLIGLAAVSLAALALSGCMLELGSGTLTLNCGPRPPGCAALLFSGAVVGTPVTGTLQMSLTLPGPGATGQAVLSDFNGTLQQELTMTGSTTTGGFTGVYTVAGGTGVYAGATGSGIWRLEPPVADGAAPVTLIGTFQVPGTASAAAARKRTFKMRATIKTARVCKVSSSRPWYARWARDCTPVALGKLAR